MNIETKSVRTDMPEYGYKEDTILYLEQLKAFGWKHTQNQKQQEGRCLRDYAIMARDLDMPRFPEYYRLEQEYESYRKQLRVYQPLDSYTLMICFLILIVPGIVYFTFKMVQKSKIKKFNNELRAKMTQIVNEAKKIGKNK